MSLLILLRLCSTGTLLRGLNEQIMVFLPKDVPELDQSDSEGGIHRNPVDTRPLSLKNTDVKLCTGTVNFKLKPCVTRLAHAAQRGFIAGRQLISNVVDLDAKMRMHGLSKCPFDGSDVLPAGWVSCEESGCGRRAAGLCAQCARKCCAPHSVFLRANFVCRWCESDGRARVARNFGKIKHRDAAVAATPIAACFDFAAAFPSVSHRWLFAILHHLEVPRGFSAFVGAIYSDNEAKYGSGRAAVTLFVIVAGILQGCPGSGSFFVVALEPFLWKFDCILKAQDRRRLGDASLATNVIRACADDIAFALCRLDTLVALKEVYDEAAVLSLLCLKPRKCVLVTVRGPPPCSRTRDPAVVGEVCTWLGVLPDFWQGQVPWLHARSRGRAGAVACVRRQVRRAYADDRGDGRSTVGRCPAVCLACGPDYVVHLAACATRDRGSEARDLPHPCVAPHSSELVLPRCPLQHVRLRSSARSVACCDSLLGGN